MNETTISTGKCTNIGMLIIRILVGGLFVFSGYMKVKDIGATVDMFGAMNLPVIVTYLVSYGELGFGILLLLGYWTRLSALVLTVIIIGAIYFTLPLGLGMATMPIVTLILLIVILKNGAGKYKIPSSHFN